MSECSSKGIAREHVLPSGETVLFRVCNSVNCLAHGKRNRYKKAKQKLSSLVKLYKECHRDGEQLYHVTIRRSLNLSLDIFWRYVVAHLRQHRAFVVVSSSHGSIEHVHALVWTHETPLKPSWCNDKRQYHVKQVNEPNGIVKYVSTNYIHAAKEFRHLATSKLTYAALLPDMSSSIETFPQILHETPQKPLSNMAHIGSKKSVVAVNNYGSGLCSHCGIRPAASKRKQCERCLQKDSSRQYNFKRRVNVNSRQYKITESAIVRLYKAQRGVCYWCHEYLPINWQIEHVKARCLGGGDTLDNVVLSCPRCNELKGTMTVKQWLSVLASRGIEHELMPDNMPIQKPLFEVTT